MRATSFIVLALILLLAGLGAGKVVIVALKENEIMSNGRRSSRLIRKEAEPKQFWADVTFNSVVCVGLVAGSAALVVSAIRGPKTKPVR